MKKAIAWFSQPVVEFYKVSGPVPDEATEQEARQIMYAYFMEDADEAPERWREFVAEVLENNRFEVELKESSAEDVGEFNEWDDWSEVR